VKRFLLWRVKRAPRRLDPAAREALESVERGMEEARARESEISEIARTLHAARERNHLAPMVRDALGGRFR
jgi:hypothetical protein